MWINWKEVEIMNKERAKELLSSADKCFEEAGVLTLFEKFGNEIEVTQMMEKFYTRRYLVILC